MSSAGYSMDQMYDALRKADASGDAEGAKAISAAIAASNGQQGSAPPVAQYQGLGRLPALAGLAAGRGVAGVAGIPGDVESLLNSGTNWLRGGVSPQEQAQQDKNRLPTGGEISSSLGLTPNALTPTTPLERYGSAAIESLPAAGAAIASGGAAAPALASSIGGGLAGQGAHDLAPDSTWAPVAAGLVTGLGVGGVANKVDNMLSASAANKSVVDAAAKLDAANAARKAALDAAPKANFDIANDAGALKKVSAADYAATRAQLDSDLAAHHAQQDAATELVASGLGKSQSLQDAGEALQQHARNWISNVLPAKVSALWAPVDAAIPADAQVNLNAFSGALKDINTSAGKLEPLASLLKPSAPKALGKTLSNVLGLDALGGGAGAPTFNWGDVQKLRTTLGDAMSNPKVINDVGDKNLQRLYATITADMRSTAAANGAGEAFDQANAGTRALYQIGEGPMSKLVAGPRPSAEDPTPESAANALLNGAKRGGTDLATLRGEIPGGIDELAAAHLRLNPKGFAALPDESVSALVPNPDQSATAIAAQVAKEQATQAQKAGYKAAQQIHQGNLDSIAAATGDKRLAQTLSLRSSKNALDEAKANHQAALAEQAKYKKGNDASNSSILGAIIGESAGLGAEHLLPLSGLGSVAGGAIGAMVPRLVKGGVNALVPSSSAALLPPGLGALSGANALGGSRQ